jgi:hypothetical protein
MRRQGILCVIAACVLGLLAAAPAEASVVGTATTTTGQTLTIAIDSPADGATLPDFGTALQGRVWLSAPRPGAHRRASQILDIEFTRDGVDDRARLVPQPDGSWTHPVGAYGPHVFGAIAVADDDTRATAYVHLTFPPKQTDLYAFAAALDQSTSTPSTGGGELRAQLSYDGGKALTYIPGESIAFLVNGQEACTAITDAMGIATCDDETVARSAIAAGGFEARYAGSPFYAPSSARARLVYAFFGEV